MIQSDQSAIKLALGTAQFGLPYGIANTSGQINQATANEMLLYAAGKGIDTLDTAIGYGESESCLGESGTNQFKIVTKLPPVPADTTDIHQWVLAQIQESLRRLKRQSLYGLLLHRPLQLLEPEGKIIFQALNTLKDYGLVENIGISIYGPNELDLLIPLYRFDLVQSPFNLIDRRLLHSGWMRRLKQEGVQLHIRSVFLQGLMLMPRAEIPCKFAAWSEIWNQWHNWLSKRSLTPLNACLAYPLYFPEIDRIIVGVDSMIQMEQIMLALNKIPNDFPDLSCNDEKLINPSRW